MTASTAFSDTKTQRHWSPCFLRRLWRAARGLRGRHRAIFGFEAVDALLHNLPFCAVHGWPPRKGGRMSLLMFKSNNHFSIWYMDQR
jgi:hypothetical protein